MEETNTRDDAGGAKVVKLPPHDDRSATPLQNPMKKHAIPPKVDDHGLCLTTGFAVAWIGGVSSGKSTCLLSCLARNHARYRYDHIWPHAPRRRSCQDGGVRIVYGH